MNIVVMKFGGTSLADPDKIRMVAERAIKARAAGTAVVLVVSAPANVTDDLSALSLLAARDPDARERDALLAAGEAISASLTAIALRGLGASAVSFSAAQAGIRTDSRYGSARIRSVEPSGIVRALKKGRIAVAAGFQGMDGAGNITTLGRGGSDLTAVALARALGARRCELYTDVKGVYTANPAIVPRAKLLPRVSYGDVMALARCGTEIRQLRAVEYAAKHGIELRIRSSFEDDPGTAVKDLPAAAGPSVTGFSLLKRGPYARVHLVGAHLSAAAARRAVKAAAAAGGHVHVRASFAPGVATLRTAFRDGEALLKTLHGTFIERPELTPFEGNR